MKRHDIQHRLHRRWDDKKPHIKKFIQPVQTLGQALYSFFMTSVGIVVIVIVGLVLLIKLIGNYYRHKYDQQYYAPPRYQHQSHHRSMRDEFDQEWRRIDHLMEQHRQMMNQRMRSLMNVRPTIIVPDASQSLSRIYQHNGNTKGYTLAVQDDMIQGTLIGEVNDEIVQSLADRDIMIDNNTFSAPYTPQLWKEIRTLLSQQ